METVVKQMMELRGGCVSGLLSSTRLSFFYPNDLDVFLRGVTVEVKTKQLKWKSTALPEIEKHLRNFIS
jgi:hypothetical protein